MYIYSFYFQIFSINNALMNYINMDDNSQKSYSSHFNNLVENFRKLKTNFTFNVIVLIID